MEASKAFVGTLRTGLADRIEHVVDLGDRLIRGDAVRRLPARKRDRAIPRVRVGAIPGPAMLLAFADRAGVLQQLDGPSPQGADRRPSFPGHQHFEIAPAGRIRAIARSFRAVSTGQGFPNHRAGLCPRVPDGRGRATWRRVCMRRKARGGRAVSPLGTRHREATYVAIGSEEIAMAIDAFAGTTPVFLPEQFFVGRLEGWAVVESLVGGLLKRASISAHGELDADTDTVVLTETYTFDDGHSDTLRWTIHKLGEGRYTGHENRLEGEAAGEQAGCAFHWKYTRDTPQGDGKSFKLNFDDWFYAIDDRACIVRGSAGRAGIPFATAHVTYRKV